MDAEQRERQEMFLSDPKQMVRDLMFRTEMAKKRQLSPCWAGMGLIAGQPRVLLELYHREGITQKELAEASCIEPATLSRALDRLEEMGYLTREDNPDCRRSFLICLTGEGREAAGRVREIFAHLEGKMLAGFTDGELDILYGYLSRVYGNLTEGWDET